MPKSPPALFTFTNILRGRLPKEINGASPDRVLGSLSGSPNLGFLEWIPYTDPLRFRSIIAVIEVLNLQTRGNSPVVTLYRKSAFPPTLEAYCLFPPFFFLLDPLKVKKIKSSSGSWAKQSLSSYLISILLSQERQYFQRAGFSEEGRPDLSPAEEGGNRFKTKGSPARPRGVPPVGAK